MIHIPVPIPRLCLSLEFDVEKSEDRPSTERHDAAIKEAARVVDGFINFSKHGVTSDAFSAKVLDGSEIDPDRPLSFTTAHNAPFDPNFHVAFGGPAIRYEFIYAENHLDDTPGAPSKLFLRIVTSFGKPEETIDGVLATRIGLTAMEILQGNDVHPTIFPILQPVPFGKIQQRNLSNYNFLYGRIALPIGYMLLLINAFLEMLGLKKAENIFRVRDTASLLKFHSSKHKFEVAHYRLYRSDAKDAFKVFLIVTKKWTENLGLHGYFYLLSASPFAAPAITNRIEDIVSAEKKYDGAFVPAGPPPGEDKWKTLNLAIADKIIFNNYGSHKHNFSAKPVSFLWDWLYVRSSAYLAACITINGVCMTCFRGLESSLQLLDCPKETFPALPTKATANTSWKRSHELN